MSLLSCGVVNGIVDDDEALIFQKFVTPRIRSISIIVSNPVDRTRFLYEEFELHFNMDYVRIVTIRWISCENDPDLP